MERDRRKIQLTMEQHGLELRGSTCTQISFNKYSTTGSGVVLIQRRCETMDAAGRHCDLSILAFWYPQGVLEAFPHGYEGTTVVLFRAGHNAKCIKVNAPDLIVVQAYS